MALIVAVMLTSGLSSDRGVLPEPRPRCSTSPEWITERSRTDTPGWRESVPPALVGLPGSTVRRRLRREDLGALAGVSADYIKRLDCISHSRERAIDRVEPSAEAQDR